MGDHSLHFVTESIIDRTLPRDCRQACCFRAPSCLQDFASALSFNATQLGDSFPSAQWPA
jgi:hypothetical protein